MHLCRQLPTSPKPTKTHSRRSVCTQSRKSTWHSYGMKYWYQARKLTLSEDRRFASTHPAVPPPTMMYLWPSSATDMLTANDARAAGSGQADCKGLVWKGANNHLCYLRSISAASVVGLMRLRFRCTCHYGTCHCLAQTCSFRRGYGAANHSMVTNQVVTPAVRWCFPLVSCPAKKKAIRDLGNTCCSFFRACLRCDSRLPR